MLGLGRALGETMAVTFVIGNAHKISSSILAPGTTISATIANEFTEAVGDLYTSSLIALGLILFVHHLHGAGDRPLPAAAARTQGGELTMRRHARYAGRRRRNAIALTLSMVATLVGLGWLALILGVLLWEGFSGLSLAGLHRDDAAARLPPAACSTPSSAA